MVGFVSTKHVVVSLWSLSPDVFGSDSIICNTLDAGIRYSKSQQDSFLGFRKSHGGGGGGEQPGSSQNRPTKSSIGIHVFRSRKFAYMQI